MPRYLSIMSAVLTVVALVAVGILAAPFARALAWALIVGIATIPHYRRLQALMPRHGNYCAGLMVVIVILFMVLPLTLLVMVIAQSSDQWSRELELLTRSVGTGPKSMISRVPFLHRLSPYLTRFGIDLKVELAKLASAVSRYLVDAAGNFALNLAGSLVTLALFLFILFFVYRDGQEIVSAAVERFASNKERARYYLGEISATTTAVMVGTLFTCFLQGVLAGVAYYFADTALPVLLGALTALAGLLPVVGTAIIWAPVVAAIAFRGDYLAAVLLLAWCVVVVVAVTDNVIRPLAVGAKSNIPPLAVVLGAVGGVVSLGLLGLILGPIVFAILVTIWRDLTSTSAP